MILKLSDLSEMKLSINNRLNYISVCLLKFIGPLVSFSKESEFELNIIAIASKSGGK